MFNTVKAIYDRIGGGLCPTGKALSGEAKVDDDDVLPYKHLHKLSP